MNDQERVDTTNPWEKISEKELLTAVEQLEYSYGGVDNAADIVRDELKILALKIRSLRTLPKNERILTLEGAARSGKSSKTDMLKQVFNELNIKSVFLDCQPLAREESQQIEFFSRIIDAEQPNVIFLDEVMDLTPEALAFLQEKAPNTIIILTMGYNVRTVDVFSIQQKWQELLTPIEAKPVKFISNSFWSRSQVRKYVEQTRDAYQKSFLKDELLENLDDAGWDSITKVVNVVSLGHPWLLNTLMTDLLSEEWSEYFDEIGEEEIFSIGRYLLNGVENAIKKLSSEETEDGKILLTEASTDSTEVVSEDIREMFSTTVGSLESALHSIISPQSFQHLYSQMLLKMVDLADLALEVKK